MNIKIKSGDVSVEAELKNCETSRIIYESLPLKGVVNTWGDEIYFAIPLHIKLEEGAKADVEVGDLGFWPTGHAFCIFFGKTPASVDSKPRAASEVNVFGRVLGDATVFKKVNDGDEIIIEK